jgi:putative ABC transport system permease protein
MSRRTPLAWNNLTHDVRRLAVAISGVAFAVILIFMELGFLNALLESTVQVLRRLNGEIVIVSSAQYALMAGERFDLRRLYQASEVPGVVEAVPVYMETMAGVVRMRGDRGYHIRVLAARPEDNALRIPQFSEYRDDLAVVGTALGDVASRREYQIPPMNEPLQEDDERELNGQALNLVGRFRLGVDFSTDGNLLMTSDNFARFFPFRAGVASPLSRVDLGVVQLEKGVDAIKVRDDLVEALPNDVDVLLREEIVDREKTFWAKNAPLGYIFLVGAVMGFVVGIVICYQIIHADISDHMREFATLKAMGYQGPFFVQLVLRQSLYLSLLGFLPGAVISRLAYMFLTYITGLTMELTLPLAASVLGVTAIMCTVSGLLAVNKLLATDPADLF